MNQVLLQPFDIETHKKEFINYLEVVILEDGTIEYAVPSHQEKLIKLSQERLKVTRDELDDLCPPEYYADFMNWLSMQCRAIPVWNEFYQGTPNEAQLQQLKTLKAEGLYQGFIKEWGRGD